MFTRPLFEPLDMIAQHELLDRVAGLAEEGTIRSTLTAELTPFNAETMRRAHEMVESGHMTGKVVVSGF
jgi:NADPH2:quinone reductase